MTLTVLTPVYNDWTALSTLIAALDRELASRRRAATLLVVDDGSPQQSTGIDAVDASALDTIEILHLRRNLGHQRAIAIGLAYLEAGETPDTVVVMDGDGEDRAEDVNRLLDTLEAEGGSRVVFAERTRRSEGLVFASLYWAYRFVHLLLTGERVRVGNFSAVPRHLLRRLVAVSDLWNHYAAAVFHARIPFTTIPTVRGTRYAGSSQMNFVSLVAHGLSAMSVFGDRIGVRLLIVTCALAAVIVSGAGVLLLWHAVEGLSIPAWGVSAGLATVVLLFLLFATSLAFVFIILAGRANPGFLPFREFAHYVSHTSSIPVRRLNAEHQLHRN
jgi:glycosyltransferase involved in cell wall biosynthesis